MYTATLIVAKASGSLDQDVVEHLCEHWDGRPILWLGVGEAAEFELALIPCDLEDIWQSLQNRGIDLVLQPSETRQKAMLFADMDSTIIQQESLDEIVLAAGVGGDQVKEITARAMNGELDFSEALAARVLLLKGQSSEVIDIVLENSITVSSGARVLVNTMRANGHYAVLVSGGFSPIASRVAQDVGFDEFFANEFALKDGVFTGEVVPPIVDRGFKRAALESTASRRGISQSGVIAVGDGANDLDMLAAAGTGVAMHAKPTVAQSCDIKINQADLRALLYIQGYRRSQFVDGSTGSF
ncbi:MAG: phosphoserine phosphatase SerB [Aestuariivita sp.]|nr:phosphoserine phosphatase SerB [Aestuariivita sp.]MCY4202780.1 phosphoserine phosphatase SerB [Aestuariivita sp.]MCY4289984.1 phosphoserine phosphatase SerB [Aestuariivita sp.]MCY4345675.1 phosphoserine phosphatase SerB [Aestuariivita sp.]